MLKLAMALLVFGGGFAVMVLEIIGPPYLYKDFGSEYYITVNQIGVILIALALGYAIGGALADRFRRVGLLAIPLVAAGLYTMFIPTLTQPMVDWIVTRHPNTEVIPMFWVRLDPILGSALVFFLPCFVLAILSPYMVRTVASKLERVGTVSGLIYSASTVGSIAGVFVTGYYLIDHKGHKEIFKLTGGLILCLAVLSLIIDAWLAKIDRRALNTAPNPVV